MSILSSKFAKLVRIVVLAEAVAAIFSTSIILPTSSLVKDALISDAQAQSTPEMPIMMIPVFMALAVAAILYIRKRNNVAAASL